MPFRFSTRLPSRRLCRPRPRARGSVYLAVLGAAVIVTTLGVTGAYLVRVHSRVSATANHSLRAAAAASGVIELARRRIAADVNWRTNHTSDAWLADISFDGGAITYKLVDERDGNLADNAGQPVRLYGKATFGRAVRIQSIELAPNASGELTPTPGSYRQEVLP